VESNPPFLKPKTWHIDRLAPKEITALTDRDLTLRNPLLNFKAEKTSLKLLCPSPGQLEDKLAAGEKISIQCVPQLSGSGPKQDAALHRQRLGESILEEYAREALEKKQLLVDLTEAELSKRSVELYRKAQTSLQEGGANRLSLSAHQTPARARPDPNSDPKQCNLNSTAPTHTNNSRRD
jgi:hypothetical protein